MDRDLRLRPLDIACGWPFDDPPPRAEAPRRAKETPAAALDALMVEALRRPPCIVSFSGGRDSSILLAAATRAARRHGLPAPVPLTFVFPGAPGTAEGDWQERVIRHLALEDWERVDRPDAMDYLGATATGVLRRHGLLFPANAFWYVLVAERARGARLLTGVGGDDLFATWRWQRAGDVLARKVTARPRDAVTLGFAWAPSRVRLLAGRRLGRVELPWLRPATQRSLDRVLARERASEPASWRRRVLWLCRLRYIAMQKRTLALLADEQGATIEHPFLHPRFVIALAAAGGRAGLGDRTDALEALFGELLPPEVLRRRGKAHFSAVWRGPKTREFVEAWDRSGVDPELVDVGRLAQFWRGPTTDARSALLLHSAWLNSQPQEVDECSTPKS